ncbi:MAG: hypothetical protein ACT4SY_07100 [Hyphomicrobiales bacterium]
MTNYDPASPVPRSLAQDVLYAARYYLGGRTGLILIAAAAIGLGAWSNWGWLVAAGLAPLLLTVLPCAAMCALGLCMGGRSRSSGDVESSSQRTTEETGEGLSLRAATPTDEIQSPSTDSNKSTTSASRTRKDCC